MRKHFGPLNNSVRYQGLDYKCVAQCHSSSAVGRRTCLDVLIFSFFFFFWGGGGALGGSMNLKRNNFHLIQIRKSTNNIVHLFMRHPSSKSTS